MPVDTHPDITEKDIENIQSYTVQNDHLRILKNCDKKLLEEKLEVLKNICDMSKIQDNMISE